MVLFSLRGETFGVAGALVAEIGGVACSRAVEALGLFFERLDARSPDLNSLKGMFRMC